MPWSKDVKCGLPCGHQIVGDDTPVAPPPQRFRTHDGAASVAPQLAQVRETGTKRIAHGVVGIVVKTIVLPECVDIRWHVAFAAAQAAKRHNVLISDSKRHERPRQCVPTKLRIGARARHGANVGDERDLDAAQQIDELTDGTRPVADGVEWIRHPQIDFTSSGGRGSCKCPIRGQRRRSRKAPPLCRAMWSVLSLLISYWGSSGLA